MIVPKPLECNSSCKECPYSTKSVSNKLEEAAEKYAYENWQSDDYHDGAADGMPFDAIGHTEKCFKAGAQWQKSQGIVEDAEINYWNHRGLSIRFDKCLEDLGFKEGDKVKVQISKMEK